MYKHLFLSTFIAVLFFGHNSYAQPIRLVGYQEIALDSFGVMMNYNAYWNNFSGNRGSTLAHPKQVGFTHYDWFSDASAADTTWAIKIDGSGNKDSSMKVWRYNSVDNPIEWKKYKWNYATSLWTPYAIEKDSFVYSSSNQLIGSYFFEYDTTARVFVSAGTFLYTYNTAGKLISNEIVRGTKIEYTWSGNDMTSELYYGWEPSTMSWRLQGQRVTTYAGSKAVVQKANGWYYLNGVPVSYDQSYDSNIYSGNVLTNKYTLMAGYYTSMYPFNFRKSYQYDVKGNIREVIHEGVDSFGVWQFGSKAEFTINSDNNPVLIKIYIYDKAAGVWRPEWRGNITTVRYHYASFPTAVAATRTETEISIYPSPAQHIINLKTVFRKDTKCTMAIFDMQGSLLRQWVENIAAGSTVTTIPVSSLPQGNYLLRLRTPEETCIKNFGIIR